MNKINDNFGIVFLTCVIITLFLVSCASGEREAEDIDTPAPSIVATTPVALTVINEPTEEITVTPSPLPASATAIAVTPEPTLVTTAVPEATLEPMATAARILPYNWSPDSNNLAYWTFTEEEVALDFTLPPGTLHFLNVSTGEICPSALQVPYGYLSPTLTWLPDGRVRAVTEQGVMVGTPCQNDFSPDDANAIVNASAASSPGGDYSVHTVEVDQSRYMTTVFEATTNETLATVEWQAPMRLGERSVGGQWLTANSFLIWETMQGPLLVTIQGEVIQVMPEFFDQSTESVCVTLSCETTLAATGASVEDADYHILLYGTGLEADYPPLYLYHSENNVVEELDFQQHGGFSPDGRTLLLYTGEFTDELKHNLWLRHVDPPNSESRLLLSSIVVNPLPVVWSPDSTKLIVNSAGDVIVFATSGDVIGTWDVSNRWKSVLPTNWAPNGRYVAVRGFSSPSIEEEALFIVEIRE